MPGRRRLRPGVTLAIAAHLDPIVFVDDAWTTPHHKRVQARLKRDALRRARKIMRIVRAHA